MPVDTYPKPGTSGRKRVRFEEDHETRQVKRRVQEISLPKSSLLTTDEKTLYWMQPEDHRYTLHDVMSLMHDCHHAPDNETSSCPAKDPNQVPFSQYAEALALTFSLCDTPPVCTEDDEDDEPPLWNIRDSQSVGQLALWASHHTPTRGVESKILPGLHQERQLRRGRAIQAVLEAQKQLNSAPVEEKISTLGALSRAFTHSAKQFATALAVVDGRQAYLEYTKYVKEQEDCNNTTIDKNQECMNVTPKKDMMSTTSSDAVTPCLQLEASTTRLLPTASALA